MKRKQRDYDSDYDSELQEDSDSDWNPDTETLNFLKKKDPKAYKTFMETRHEIKKNNPTLIQILKEPLFTKDRSLILQYYDIYASTDSVSEKHIELKIKIIKLVDKGKKKYQEYNKYTPTEHKQMKHDLSLINTNIHTEKLEYQILSLNTSIENKKTIYNKYKTFTDLTDTDDEYHKLKHWLNWAINIPHDNITTFNYTTKQHSQMLLQVSNTLDAELYGMKKAKEQILLFLNAKLTYPNMKNISLGLIGSPGAGKTTLARTLATTLNFPFQQISMGGVNNPDFLKGHSYTYVGSQPGEIVRSLRNMKSKNGILFLDEYDKISDDKNITASLLHITDPSQNMIFRDNFLEGINIDLSHLWFIFSMNKLPSDEALRDRIFTIEIPDYSLQDKIQIAKNYIIPKTLKKMNIDAKNITIGTKTIQHIIETYLQENDGVRPLERLINNILNKLGFIYNNKQSSQLKMSFWNKKIKFPFILTTKNIEKFIE